jgi:hypothetical protein
MQSFNGMKKDANGACACEGGSGLSGDQPRLSQSDSYNLSAAVSHQAQRLIEWVTETPRKSQKRLCLMTKYPSGSFASHVRMASVHSHQAAA